MNRIKELREARGLSAADLAEMVGTSQPQITRLERGVRRLTVEWMTRIARALDCRPMDLIASATMAEIATEAARYSPADVASSSKALAAKGLAYYRVTSDSVEQTGIAAGDVVLIDMSEAAVDAVKTGDIVIAELQDLDSRSSKARTVVRQFIAPNLLTTNRRANNIVVSMINEAFEARIRGVLVRDEETPT